MKRTLLALATAGVLATGSAIAGTTAHRDFGSGAFVPVQYSQYDHRSWDDRTVSINEREARIRNRIERGMNDGRITNREARRLLRQLAAVEGKERTYLADGRLNHREEAQLKRDLDVVASNVRTQLRDDDRVRAVVEPDAEDLARPRDDRAAASRRRAGRSRRSAAGRRGPRSACRARARRRRAAAARRRPRPAPRTGARRASSSRSGSRRRRAGTMSKRGRGPGGRPRAATGRTSACLTAPMVSFSRYGSSGKNTCVTSGSCPGASTLKWMCAGRHGCWPTASR